MSAVQPCRTIKVFAFRGVRSRIFAANFLGAIADEKNGSGPGPTILVCLLFGGHAGVSTDQGAIIYGFNPDRGGIAVWQWLDRLKSGDPFPGVVCDDTTVFLAAQQRALSVLSFDIILPDPRFQEFQTTLDAERQSSHYSYGFPNGDGDCNCVTWPERLGLPLLTGRMDEFVALRGILASRRFGQCL
jgi:hypothetical protein